MNIFAAFYESQNASMLAVGIVRSNAICVVGAKLLDCFTKIGTPTIALPALLLISLTVAGCRKDAEVNATVSAVDALTTELARRIEAAANPSDGVDDAQQYLDSRKTEIADKMGALKSLRDDQVSDETRRKLTSRLAEDAAIVGNLQVKYVSHSISNAAFKAKLDKLVSDYQTLLTR
ncbi:MAG TPA: hypothetical protein VEV42_18880 [Pyrinomonadaceae bacterium]|jgi:outer membrane murein-binding lipoprotein Lpp|nr:hypothetical protein [Pyrinomonadaceae bacterium]